MSDVDTKEFSELDAAPEQGDNHMQEELLECDLAASLAKAVITTPIVKKTYDGVEYKFQLTELRLSGLNRGGLIQSGTVKLNNLARYDFRNPHNIAAYNKHQEEFYKDALDGFLNIYNGTALPGAYTFDFRKNDVKATLLEE